MTDEQLMETAIDATYLAGLEIMKVYATDFSVEKKGDNSPLTRADKAAHQTIAEALKKTGLPVLSEEGRDIPFSERKNWERFWMVDPLDGTKEFVKRNGEFTVNIALIEKGKSIAGVVLVPETEDLYFGLQGLGAFKYEGFKGWQTGLESLAKASEILPTETDREKYVIIGSRSHSSDESKQFMEKLIAEHPNNEIISMGSSKKICYVADGKADIYPRFAPTMEWDTAAAHAIVKLAGKEIHDHKTAKPMVYNKEDLLNNWFVVR
jgi:3'(2'), 5'-bisphosphate nucleotidase